MRATFALLILSVPMLPAATPTDLDRQRVIAHFQMTESWLADEIAGLSPEQLRFRPSPTVWSVTDCVEHLVLAERNYWSMYQGAMKQPPVKKGSPSQDVDRLWYGIDRTERAKTVGSETPKSTFPDAATALAEFRKLRTEMLGYIQTTQEDWRHHLIPEWSRDGYQWLVMISAHSQRHILQIREIKHDANFPGVSR